MSMGKVQHFEIMADDPQRASKFYSECFEWNISKVDKGEVDMDYWMVMATTEDPQTHRGNEVNAISGGLMKRPMPQAKTIIYVSVESIEDTLAKVSANGGRVMKEKFPIGPKEKPMGFIAIFEDTEGNHVGLWADK